MSIPTLPQGVLPGTISLVFGHPDAGTLPVDDLFTAAKAVLRGPEARLALAYGAEQGAPALIEYLLNKLNRDEALGLTRDNLMIVAGATSAVDMIARLYTGRHGVVLVEAPTYHDALHVFRDHDADLRSVPVDEDGLIVGALEAQLAALEREGRSPRLLYTIPNFQNPAGVTLTAARRLLCLAHFARRCAERAVTASFSRTRRAVCAGHWLFRQRRRRAKPAPCV